MLTLLLTEHNSFLLAEESEKDKDKEDKLFSFLDDFAKEKLFGSYFKKEVNCRLNFLFFSISASALPGLVKPR